MIRVILLFFKKNQILNPEIQKKKSKKNLEEINSKLSNPEQEKNEYGLREAPESKCIYI